MLFDVMQSKRPSVTVEDDGADDGILTYTGTIEEMQNAVFTYVNDILSNNNVDPAEFEPVSIQHCNCQFTITMKDKNHD